MVNGQREFWTINPDTLEYEAPGSPRFDSVGATRKIEELGERLGKLLAFDDRAATYVRDTIYFMFSLRRLCRPEIAYKLTDVDDAALGLAHEAGPLQIWDMLGVAETVEKMEGRSDVADWVKEMLANGSDSFTKAEVTDFVDKKYKLSEPDKNIILGDLHAAGKEVERT
ncbi:MAG: hypothetical protein H6667_01285 [Ardenticatenaceae bacterium]|nr:hypothetical protein [Ardenticatenaceae bacterium]